MEKMTLAVNKSYFYIRDIPAERPLTERIGESLLYLRLVAIKYFLVAHFAFIYYSASPFARFKHKFYNRPAWFRHCIRFKAVPNFRRSFFINYRGRRKFYF